MSSHYVPQTRIPTLVFPTSSQAARHVALMIESLIRQNNSASRPTVLGLATGSTPVGLYRELIRLHKEAGLDFSRVITFNLDEYFPMPAGRSAQLPPLDARDVLQPRQHPAAEHPHSRRHGRRRRRRGLLRPLRAADPPGRRHRPANPGHRPHRPHRLQRAGSTRHSRTRLVTLDPVTRRDAASDFFGEENVPHQAITMGVGTILEARKVVIMAFGEHKAPIVQPGASKAT